MGRMSKEVRFISIYKYFLELSVEYHKRKFKYFIMLYAKVI